MASDQAQGSGSNVSGRLWGGRFTGASDPLMVAYNESIYFDRIFYAQDIKGSIAWARANAKAGILTAEEFETIKSGLERVLEEWKDGKFVIKSGVDEDIHTANERRLGEIIGKEIGGKLHTGRSRNDQVATDLRLWLRDQLRELETHLIDLLSVVAERAQTEIEYIMAGYGTFFLSDLERLREVIKRVNKSPLGCGALSGNAFKVDREAIAKELGFDGLIYNSMAAVGDRDFVLEAMQWASMLMLHISRLSEDLIIYSTAEFSFVRLAEAYTTGSSLMPQKRNCDSLELLRGKCGRVFGQMTGLSMSVKGIPSTYNKDLQESVEPLLECIKTVKDSLLISARVLATLTVHPENMLAAVTPDILATELAEYLVRKGVPFRETHHISGRVVALSEKESTPMDKLSLQQLQDVDSRFGSDVLEVFNPERAVDLKSASGGTGRNAVEEQIRILREAIADKK